MLDKQEVFMIRVKLYLSENGERVISETLLDM